MNFKNIFIVALIGITASGIALSTSLQNKHYIQKTVISTPIKKMTPNH